MHVCTLQYSNISIYSMSFHFNIPHFHSLSSSTSYTAGMSGTNVLLYSFGFIFSVVLFPIGLVLWMLSCCKVFIEESDDSSHTCYSSPNNSTSESICNTVFLVSRAGIFNT